MDSPFLSPETVQITVISTAVWLGGRSGDLACTDHYRLRRKKRVQLQGQTVLQIASRDLCEGCTLLDLFSFGGSAVKSFFLPFAFLSQPCAYVAVLCLTPGSAVILSRPTFCGLIHRISVGSEVLRFPTITNRCPDVGSIQSTKVISASDSAASII